MDPRPIGVFDSGVGGLTVLHECLVTLPHEDFTYVGDNARLPYGPRPLAEIRRYAHEVAAFLASGGREAGRRGLQLGHCGRSPAVCSELSTSPWSVCCSQRRMRRRGRRATAASVCSPPRRR